MLNTELQDASTCLNNILNKFPHTYHFKLNGTYKLITPPLWKQDIQNNTDQHLLFVKNGKGKYIFDNSEVNLYRGIIIYVSDHCIHRAINDEKEPLEIISLRFDIYDNRINEIISVDRPFIAFIMPDDILKSGIKFHKFYEDINSNNFGDIKNAITNTFISEMLIEIFKYIHLQNINTIDNRIEEGKKIIEVAKHKNISIDTIANNIGISERYFRKLFKITYGLSPKKYHLKVRMNYARFLLLETKFSVKEVALEVGYSDAYTFSRQYKNFFGYPPTNRD